MHKLSFYLIVNKLPSFYDVIHTYDPDIIVGCETWPTNNIVSSEIFPPNYTVFRKDRTLQHGEGVFLACRDSLTCVDIHINNNCEAVVGQIRIFA